MPSLDSPCFLLPQGATKSPVYVCIPVDVGVAKRSPVIETLMEYEGLVQLPAGVSLDDFAAWSAMKTDEPANLENDELCVALQVSDKLSAHDTGKLTETLAARLKTTQWGSFERARSMLNAFRLLNRNLQQLVIRAMGKVSLATVVTWPFELQQVYADQLVSPGHISIAAEHSTESATAALLSVLALADPALPGLRCLSIDCPIPTTVTAALCGALHHHSNLSHLELGSLSWLPAATWPPAVPVFRSLPQLTALTALTLSCCMGEPASGLSVARIDAAMDCVHALAAAIPALPTLESFHLYNQPEHDHPEKPPDATAVPKRRKIARCFGPPSMHAKQLSLDPVIAALSTAPALTALMFTYTITENSEELPCSGIVGPFECLQSLELYFSVREGDDSVGDDTVALTLRPTSSLLHIEPLPALWRMNMCCPVLSQDAALFDAFLRSASCQPALRDVRLDAHSRPHTPRATHLFGDWFSESEDEDTELEVHMSHAHPVSVNWMRMLAVGLSYLENLHSLRMQYIRWSDGDHEASYQHDAPGDVCSMMQPLAALTGLQELRIYGKICQIVQTEIGMVSRAILLGPLQCLAKLTHLCLGFEDVGILPAMLSQGVQALTALRVIALSGVQSEWLKEVIACFSHCTALAALTVSTRPVNATVVQCFAESIAGLPQMLGCASLEWWAQYRTADAGANDDSDSCTCKDWVQGLVHLSPRGRYVFALGSVEEEEEMFACVREQLIAKGASVSVVPGFMCASMSVEVAFEQIGSEGA